MHSPVELFKDHAQQEVFEQDGFALFRLFPRDVVHELLRLFARIEPGMRQDPNWPD